jgi:hypothetical protein
VRCQSNLQVSCRSEIAAIQRCSTCAHDHVR